MNSFAKTEIVQYRVYVSPRSVVVARVMLRKTPSIPYNLVPLPINESPKLAETILGIGTKGLHSRSSLRPYREEIWLQIKKQPHFLRGGARYVDRNWSNRTRNFSGRGPWLRLRGLLLPFASQSKQSQILRVWWKGKSRGWSRSDSNDLSGRQVHPGTDYRFGGSSLDRSCGSIE